MSVIVKVTLSTNEESEVRRFQLSEDVSTSFVYLQDKLMSMFPQLQKGHFIITWKDREKDDVRITNDEELCDAVVENFQVMQEDLLRLNVRVQTQKKPAHVKTDGEEHQHVVCDGCNGEIKGFRYKCVQCPDFDLCAECEEKGLHPGHNMIRIVQPIPMGYPWKRFMRLCHRWFPFYGGEDWTPPCRMSNRRSNEGCKRRCDDRKKREEKEEGEGSSNSDAAMDNDGPTESKKKPGRREGPQFHFPHSQQFGEMLNGVWAGLAGPAFVEVNEGTNPASYLRNVGEQVAAMLDPMGIDVHVDVVGQNGNFSCATKKKQKDGNKEKASKGETGEQKPNEEDDSSKKQKDYNIESEEESEMPPSMTVETNIEKEILEHLVNKQKKVTEEMAEAVASMNIDEEKSMCSEDTPPEGEKDFVLVTPPVGISLEATETPQQEDAGAVPKQSTQPSAPVNTDESEHPDPRVAKGLRQMLAMGFTNEGGWLTQLLEVKEGDIGQVLDVLLPIRKNKN